MDMRLTNPTHWPTPNSIISIQDHLTFDHPTTQPPWPNPTSYYPRPFHQNQINDLPDPHPPVGETIFGGRNSQFTSGNEVVEVEEEGEEEEDEDEEELGAMKEMMFRMAAMQPVDIDPASVRRPRRRNVRISDDPQSVAARRRRERISERMRILQRLVPGGTKMDTASMLDEAVRYLKFLKRQIRFLQAHPRRPQMPGYSLGGVVCDDVASGSGGGGRAGCGGRGCPMCFTRG